ncbi:MAG: hypothetical protein AAB457_03745 [Patescibacteria group bacterium]
MKIVFSILIGALFLAVLPLFNPGFLPTHDGEYHMIRFYEFETMLRAGYWFPRWAPGLNSGYGVPLFNFHYPFPNYIGAFYHSLGWSLSDAFKLALATGYLSAGLFCYFWLSKIFDKFSGAVGTIAFLFVPYWFVELYVRGSVGEVIAIAWFMLVLAAIEYRNGALVSVATAGMILSHNILSMVFLPLLAGYMVLRTRWYLGYMIIGLGLAAYFWIPALWERNFVVGLNVVNFREHFPELFQLLIPFGGTNFSQAGVPDGEMSQQLGVMTIVVGMFALAFCIGEKEQWLKRLIGGSLSLLLLVIVLMLSISRPVWETLAALPLLQYPWRLLAVVVPLAGLLAAYFGYRLHSRWIGIVIAIMFIGFSLPYTKPVTYAPRDDRYYLSRREFTDGTSSLGNSFSTVWSPWKSSRAGQVVDVTEGKGTATVQSQKPLSIWLAADIKEDAMMRVNVLYFPGWNVRIDGKKQTIDYKKDGTVSFPVGKGSHEISVLFTETPVRVGADLVSFACLFWLICSTILKRYYAHSN